MAERHGLKLADRLDRRMGRHELDRLRFFRLALATVSIVVALVGLALIRLAAH
ncbi:MAG: hypothetical protein ACYC6V_09765 [Bacillota bacterium]